MNNTKTQNNFLAREARLWHVASHLITHIFNMCLVMDEENKDYGKLTWEFTKYSVFL